VKSVICSVAIVVTATVVHAQCPVPPANTPSAAANSLAISRTQLGTVFNEANNLCAQSAANAGWPVIALLKAAGHGHVALVIPGQPTVSNSWGMLTANSASFFLDKPTSVYLNKGLSSAFGPTNAQKAVFFYRKPS
jgi:hypothetical protein